MANTAEEKGLLGAEYFARHPTIPIKSVTAAIDLGMPLLLYDFTDAVALRLWSFNDPKEHFTAQRRPSE